MKSKKIISAIAAAVLAFGMTANAATTMTLEEATTYALANSPTYKSAVAAAKSSEYAAKVAKSTYNDYHDSDSALAQMSISSFDLYLVRLGYVKNAAELQMRAAQRASETAEYELKTNVKNTYYTYLSSIEKVKIAEENLNLANKHLEDAKKKLSLGTIAELGVKTFEMSAMQAESSFEDAKRTSDQALIKLKNTIGYTDDDELVVSGSFERNTEEVLSSDAVIAQLDNYSGMKSLTEGLELAKERFTLAERWYFSSENEYWQEKYTYEKAQNDYISNVNSMKFGVVQLYDSLRSLEEGITALEYSGEVMDLTLEAAELQYELGMITAQKLVETRQDSFEMKNQIMDGKLQEWILKLQYKSFYTTEQ